MFRRFFVRDLEYDEPGRDVDVERAYRHVPRWDRTRAAYESNGARSNEDRNRRSHSHVPAGVGHDSHYYTEMNEGTSRRAPRREQVMPNTRNSSRRQGRSESMYYYIPSRQAQREQIDESTHSSHRRRRSETTPHTSSRRALSSEPSDDKERSSHGIRRHNFSRQAQREQSDDTTHSSHRRRLSKTTLYTSRRAPSREPSDDINHTSHRIRRYTFSRQAQREQTDDCTNYSHRRRRSETSSSTSSSRAPSSEPSDDTKRSSYRIRRYAFSRQAQREQTDDTTPSNHPRRLSHTYPRTSFRRAPSSDDTERSSGRGEKTSRTFSSRQTSSPQEDQTHRTETSTNRQTPGPEPAAPRTGVLYAILGLSPEATQAEIIRAARRRRIQVHPDKLKTAGMAQEDIDRIEDEAQEVGLAADTLCDEVSRGEYDRAVRLGLRI